jgi:TolB-like protein
MNGSSSRHIIAALLLVYSHVAFSVQAAAELEPAPTLAVFAFRDAAGTLTDMSDKLSLLIFSAVTERNLRVTLLDRDEIDRITDEYQLSGQEVAPSALVDLGADYVLTGHIFILQDKVYLNGKLIDVASRQVQGISIGHPLAAPPDQAALRFAQGIADFLARRFPQDPGDNPTAP